MDPTCESLCHGDDGGALLLDLPRTRHLLFVESVFLGRQEVAFFPLGDDARRPPLGQTLCSHAAGRPAHGRKEN